MRPGRDRTLSPCICSQTCICNPTRYRLRCETPLSHEMNDSSGVSKVNSICVYIRPKHFLFSVTLTTLIFWGLLFMPPCPQRNFWRHIVIALSVSPSVPLRVRFISPLFFEVGIPILICGYILGWRSVAYHFRVPVTLNFTSDLVFRIIVSGAYLLYYLR